MTAALGTGRTESVPDTNKKMPFLRRVRIRGYKSIAFCDVTLEPLTILVGRNASGKSNFLEALAFVQHAMETNITQTTNHYGGWHSILSHSSTARTISFEAEVSLPPTALLTAPVSAERQEVAEYGFVLGEGPSESLVLLREWFRTRGTNSDAGPYFNLTGIYDPSQKAVTYNWTFDHKQLPCSLVPHPRPDRLWIGSFGVHPFIDVSDGLRFSGYYNFHPDAIRRVQKPSPGSFLERDGKNVASVIETTRENDKKTIDRVSRYLSVITESIELLGVAKYGEYETVRFRVDKNGQDQPPEFDAANMSDGTLRTLAALVAAFQIVLPHGYPGLVAIEEPETSLHPAAMRALVDALDEATLRTQILLTTHSAEMLDNPTIRPENIRVVQMIDGQTVIGPVDEASVEIVHRRLNTLGGLEREDQLEPDLDDQDRQRQLAQAQQESP